MATTPEEWLPILAKRMDARAPKIAELRQYASGNAPLPELGKNTRASWEAFRKKARTDYAGLACQSIAGRIVPIGVEVGTGVGAGVTVGVGSGVGVGVSVTVFENALRQTFAVAL